MIISLSKLYISTKKENKKYKMGVNFKIKQVEVDGSNSVAKFDYKNNYAFGNYNNNNNDDDDELNTMSELSLGHEIDTKNLDNHENENSDE